MRSINLAALHIFKTVVEEGGITKAAVKLHRVQSNITTRVKQLEAKLGTKLFLRQKRRLVLSPEGKLLLVYADRLLRLSTEAEAMLRDNIPRGTLKIGTMESTAAARLPPILSRYHKRYPEVCIELVTATAGVLVTKVLNYEIEAAFVAEPIMASNLDFQVAFDEELVLIAPSGYPRIKTARDIGKRTVIAFGAGCAYRARLEDWLGRSKVAPDRVMEFHSYHAIVACVAAGTGIAIVPRSVLRVVNVGSEVSTYSLPSDMTGAKTLLVWRREHQSTALEAMIKQCRRNKR
jgi:DNA-binding transcriptional LysR family regulator